MEKNRGNRLGFFRIVDQPKIQSAEPQICAKLPSQGKGGEPDRRPFSPRLGRGIAHPSWMTLSLQKESVQRTAGGRKTCGFSSPAAAAWRLLLSPTSSLGATFVAHGDWRFALQQRWSQRKRGYCLAPNRGFCPWVSSATPRRGRLCVRRGEGVCVCAEGETAQDTYGFFSRLPLCG